MVPLTASNIHLVVAPSADAAGKNGTVQRLVRGGAMCVSPKYIIDWLFKPHGSLREHVLLGEAAKGSKIKEMEAARKEKPALGGGSKEKGKGGFSSPSRRQRVQPAEEAESPQF